MTSSSTQNDTHSILDHPHMRWLWENAHAYETNALGFWNARWQKSFPEAEWAVMLGKYVELNPGWGDERTMDTYIAYYNGETQSQVAAMFHEAKRERNTAAELGRQALAYARDAVKERGLEFLWVLTTIGTRFRTWYISKGEDERVPLFEGPGCEMDSYLEAATGEASDR